MGIDPQGAGPKDIETCRSGASSFSPCYSLSADSLFGFPIQLHPTQSHLWSVDHYGVLNNSSKSTMDPPRRFSMDNLRNCAVDVAREKSGAMNGGYASGAATVPKPSHIEIQRAEQLLGSGG